MFRFQTQGFNGYSVKFSPFFEDRIACASAANFGLVGNGRLWILRSGAGPHGVDAEKLYDTQDGLYDVAWSEQHEHQLVTGSGDGSVKLWDVTLSEFPIQNWSEHTREVYSVNWNLIRKDTFLTASWDLTVKWWTPERPQSLATFAGHQHCVYEASWSPHEPDLFASACGDRIIRLWDARQPGRPTMTIHGHQGEVLSLDWNKYQPYTLASGSVDKTVRVWDARRPDRELSAATGHEYAVRRVRFSPHQAQLLASASYDMTMRIWDMGIAGGIAKPVETYGAHTEFVLGVDWNLYHEGELATCAWDEQVHIVRPALLASGQR
ncbi:WD40-repeat-containing domain protein [Thamnocephalis sphaerospora]|uniref:Peroxin-7 n=1 Tax=Thamnocephalis sphaerospora TaxID=78915 RepID=A0A4P9XSN3_9FUNG|nr:WD40-repeat-containing domain protein [Thamnocephalis sphaerospora]|eukprot:RKP08501.1 WD40-repeat-containing domain protein [Thamnocephalis sphaerospora]